MNNPALIRDISMLSGRIGILGGSFDPVHADHIAMAEAVKKNLSLDSVVFLPTPQNPLKNQTFFNENERIKILLAAAENRSNFYVCTLETDKNPGSGSTYTTDTLDLLNSTRKQAAEVFFILGADCLTELHHWHDFHSLFLKATLVPVQRGEGRSQIINRLRTEANLTSDEINSLEKNWVGFESVKKTGDPVSSTEIRSQLLSGHIPEELLTDSVSKVISGIMKNKK